MTNELIAKKLKSTDSLKVIIGPHMTEKSYADGESTQSYIFKVIPKSNKQDIKYAIENFFNVKVKSVKTLNVKGKVKSFKQKLGKRKSWKKAYVQLHEGYELDFIGAAEKG